MAAIDIQSQFTQTLQTLPEQVQADLLALAKDWSRAYEDDQASQEAYDAQLLDLLKKRAAEADADPQSLVPAEEMMERFRKKWLS
ncbi:MAG TPA: hypothetical protein DCE41_33350 [Cytophagales bacterium]|nr:hypothetical protein [Cytophagales bacterium]HAP61555.1 hypothetical protein [Cytophagales bacterium]